MNAANLAGLGAHRLAEILLTVADTRPELKRQLRMELAAEQGVEHLAAEIDKRLTSLETLRSKVSWRQRPAFLRDLEALRKLISERMAALDGPAAVERLARFINLARQVEQRVRDKHGELDVLFEQAATDLGPLLATVIPTHAATVLAEAIERNPRSWKGWLPLTLGSASQELAAAALIRVQGHRYPELPSILRALADAAADVDAYRATFTENALRDPGNAASVASRYLNDGRVEAAGALLESARPSDLKGTGAGKSISDDVFEWETVWIDYLERSGQQAAAQSARWTSFERTLSVERAKAFIRRLKDFDDVEAEERAFAYASRHPDFARGFSFLMDWPAIAEAGRMVEARIDDVRIADDVAELCAAKLARVKPRAAHILLRKAAAIAFKRRNFTAADRLTKEADAIALE